MIDKYEQATGRETIFTFSKDIQEQNPAYYLGEEIAAISEWMESIKESPCLLYAKRLSANDTGATKSNQVGVYVPIDIIGKIFPEVANSNTKNPDYFFSAKIESHSLPEQTVRAIYYNGKLTNESSRNEARITRWKEISSNNPMQDPNNTGALALFAFLKSNKEKNSEYLKVWLCTSPEEEGYAELILGEVLPGNGIFGPPLAIFGGSPIPTGDKQLKITLPDEWEEKFPSGIEILNYIFSRFTNLDSNPDKRLLKRRNIEFAIFKKIEELHSFDLISKGFENVDEFIAAANSITNRRKSRSGKSLEINLERIFTEEGLVTFSSQCVTENNKKPDFIFPSCKAYHDVQYPNSKLRMLAVKTTCKDRWRQLLNEANRINNPFLFTLQEGVSINQYEEMKHEGVTLVAPERLHEKYPEKIRSELLTLSKFIHSTKEILAQ